MSTPKGYHTVTPYLIVKDIESLITFLKETFDAVETERIPQPDGSVGHVQVRIGDSIIMMGQSQEGFAPMSCMLYVYTGDTDATYNRALKAGATTITEPADQFYGDRSAGVQGPQGNQWWIATRIEDLTPEEIQKRALSAKQ